MEHLSGKPRASRLIILPRQWRLLLLTALVLGSLPLILKNDYLLLLFNVMGLNALVVLGLNLLIGSTGQVSLGHAAFYGMGAYISAIASTTWQWPLGSAFLLAVLAVALVSFLLALPTLRLEGHYLVMATLGFNIIVNILMGQMESITGGPSGFPGIPKLHIGSWVLKTDLEFYYFIWGFFLLAFALTLNLKDSRVGRALQAIHEKDLTAQALGIPTYRYKVATFVLSAVYAAMAGFCYAHYITFISPKTFDIFYSVQVVTMVVVGGLGSLWGGLAGTALLTYLPELLHRFEDLHVLLYGLILMGALVFLPQGVVPTLRSSWLFTHKYPGRRFPAWFHPQIPLDSPLFRGEGEGRSLDSPFDKRASSYPPLAKGVGGNLEQKILESSNASHNRSPLLSLKQVSLDFGGLQVLQEVDMEVFPGEIVALIGPNGAGKTTLLNLISGLLTPRSGDIRLRGKSLLGLRPYQIADQGIGRTFQTVQIYQHFSVLENVLVGYHARGRSGFLSAYLHTPRERGEERQLRDQALDLLDHVGMASKAFQPVQQLTLLEQKRLELARALALGPCILLLDEPVGGLNPRESEILVGHVAMLRQSGMGIILVEHDMNMVMRLADRVVVLQNGFRIASGTPKAIQRDPKVIEAYLGTRKP